MSSTFGAHSPVHSDERAISLSLKVCPTNLGSLVIGFGLGTQSDPCISSVTTAIMDHASPVQVGRLPWSADGVNDAYQKATSAAGIGHVSTHTMRHTYRSWLDAVGTSIAVQQKLMRHADIRTTMNIYGDIVTDEMEQAHSKVVRMALAPVN
ncbi:MAG: tyrosine-type recombinase/integrase [Terriglobales bacterium]